MRQYLGNLSKVLGPMTRDERIKFMVKYAIAFGKTYGRDRSTKNIRYRRKTIAPDEAQDTGEAPGDGHGPQDR